jgi:hypothetical protein
VEDQMILDLFDSLRVAFRQEIASLRKAFRQEIQPVKYGVERIEGRLPRDGGDSAT